MVECSAMCELSCVNNLKLIKQHVLTELLCKDIS